MIDKVKIFGFHLHTLKEFHIYESGTGIHTQDIDKLKALLIAQNKIRLTDGSRTPFSVISYQEAEILDLQVITHYATAHIKQSIIEKPKNNLMELWG